MILAYIDDILVINKNDFRDHIKELYRFLQRHAEARLKINTENTFFGRKETEYIGF